MGYDETEEVEYILDRAEKGILTFHKKEQSRICSNKGCTNRNL